MYSICVYYMQIQMSNKPEDVEIRKKMYSFFSADGSSLSQKVRIYVRMYVTIIIYNT